MKLLKWIVIVVLILILIPIVAIVVVLNSAGIQKSIVMGQLEKEAVYAKLDYVKAGLSGIVIRDLEIDRDHTLVQLKSAEIDYKLTDAIFGDKLVISRADVDGLVVTLPAARKQLPYMGPGPVIPPQTAPEAEKPETGDASREDDEEDEEESTEPPPPFEGIFKHAKTPLQLYIDDINVEATVKITPERTFVATITGGGIAPGQVGSIKDVFKLTDTDPGAQAETVSIDSVLTISQTADKRLNAITLKADTTAEGGALKTPAKATLNVDLKANDNGNETYTINLSDASKTFAVSSKTVFDPGAKSLVGNVGFRVDHRSVRPYLAKNAKLPDFSSNGKLTYELSSEDYSGKSSLTTKGLLKNLGAVDSSMKDIPDVTFEIDYEGDQQLDTIQIDSLNAKVAKAGGSNLFLLKLLQPVILGANSNIEKLKGEVAALTVDGVDARWLSPMLEGIDVKSGLLSGALNISADEEVVTFASSKPFSLANLTVTMNGKPTLQGLTTTLPVQGKLTEDSLSLVMSPATVKNAQGKRILNLKLDSQTKLDDHKPESAIVNVSSTVNMVPLIEQPAFTTKLKTPVQMALGGNFSWSEEGDASVDKLVASLRGGSGQNYIALEQLKKIEVNLNNKHITPASLLQGDPLRLKFVNLPRELINSLGNDIELTSGNLTGELTLGSKGDAVVIKSEKPLSLSKLTLNHKNKAVLNDFNFSMVPNIEYSEKNTALTFTQIKGATSGKAFLGGSISANVKPGDTIPLQTANIDLTGNLALLLKQPVLSKFDNLDDGTFTAKGKVDMVKSGDFNFQVTGNNLRIASTSVNYPMVSMSASGKAKLPDRLDFKAPLSIKGPKGETALNVSGNVEIKNDIKHFQIKSMGKTVFLDDLQGLSTGFKNPATAQTPPVAKTARIPTPPPAAPKTALPVKTAGKAAQVTPPWAGYVGTADLAIEKVVSGQYEITGVKAVADVSEPKVVLKPLKASFMNAPLDAEAVITCLPDQRPRAPFGVNAKMTFTQFDVGQYLAYTKPGTTPPLTGKFNVKGGLQGTAPTLNQIADTATGSFELNGGPGQLRALSAVGKGADQAVSGASAAIGIAGALLGNKVRELPALNQLLKLLQTIDYQTLQIKANRQRDLNINIDPFLLQGPQVRLIGTGNVKHAQGKPIPEQPLNLNISLDAKGETANLLSELRLGSSQKDKSGYFKGPSFTVTGTPANPDFSELQAIIVKAGTESALGGSFGGRVNEKDASTQKKQPSDVEQAAGLIKGLFGN